MPTRPAVSVSLVRKTTRSIRRLWTLALIPAFLASIAQAQTPTVTLGGEFQVNTYTSSGQFQPSVSVGRDGAFVVVWQSYASTGTDTSYVSVQGQRYASDGSAIGGEFQVNTYTTNRQRRPSVSVAPDGDFVVVWESLGSGMDPSYLSVQGQRYASDGSAIGGEFQVNTYTTNNQYYPSASVAPSGDFVVVWTSNFGNLEIRGQRYDSGGTAIGSEFQANTIPSQFNPSVSVGPSGGFVVVWQGLSGIRGQRFHSNGSLIGGEFQVNTGVGFQSNPSVSVSPDGGFVVVWEGGSRVQGRRYDSAGSAIGGEFQVNTIPSFSLSFPLNPSVSTDQSGDFVVVWQSFGSSGTDTSSISVQAQRYASDGSAVSGQFQVNTYTTSQQRSAQVSADPDGDFVVVWTSYGSSGTDNSFGSIQGQRFRVTADVGDLVFLDEDFDGLQDVSEPGIEGVTVHLYEEGGGLLGSTQTDVDGAFLFQPKIGLTGVVDQFYLDFEPPFRYSFTATDIGVDDTIDSDADQVFGQTESFAILSAGDANLDIDAGMTNGIGDRVWLDADGNGLQDGGESGVSGVSVELFDGDGASLGTTATSAAGRYAFADLFPGEYYLVFTAPLGFVFTSRDQGIDEAADSDANPASGTTTKFVFTYGDILLNWDAGLEIDTDQDGVADRIDLCPGFDDGLDADGDGVPDGCDQCQGDDATGDVDGDLICADLDCDDNDATNACAITSVGDSVWLDANLNGLQDGGESGFGGVTVELFTQAGVSQGTALTLADGSYSFTGLSAGTYYLAFSEPPGHCYTAQDQGNDDGLDSDVNPVTFTTAPFVLVDGQSDVSRDGGLVPDASIGNRVWLDDGDGLQAGGEPGVANVTVNLYNAGKVLLDTTTTDAGGFYTFAPGPGDYYLEFVLPSATVFAPRDVGDDDLVDSDVFAASGTTVIFNLGPGQVDASRDAGLELDGDGDGIADRLDNCPADANPSQTDSDGDGSGDVCDLCQGNDATGDSDADGVCDDMDICPGFDDALDADGDGVPDGCDQCQGNDATGDSDADGVCDDLDICAGFDDALDADGDSVPDGCDVCPGFDDALDADGDGVPDGCDQCQGNDASGDSDADGVCDDLDICAGFDDSLDADGDGVPDGCDVCQGNDATGDADGDLICADIDCNDNDATNACAVFSDGFETGDTSSWSLTTVP